MRIRIILIGSLLLAPALALAADNSSLGPASSAGAVGLGPTTSGTGVSSSADSSVLQPAGTTPLQSTTGDSSGLTPTSDSTLQASGASDQLKVLIGNEADGSQRETAASAPNNIDRDIALLGLLVLAGASGYWFWRRRYHPYAR